MAAVDDSVGPSRRTAEQVLVERAIKPSNKQEQAVFAWGQGEDGQLGYAPPPSVPHNRTSHVDQLNGQLGWLFSIDTVPRVGAAEGLETFLCTPTWLASTNHVRPASSAPSAL